MVHTLLSQKYSLDQVLNIFIYCIYMFFIIVFTDYTKGNPGPGQYDVASKTGMDGSLNDSRFKSPTAYTIGTGGNRFNDP